ncbi:S8 family serine peptidase [Microcoleus sp. M2_C5]|uniref:S8 family serine peptidase n=1 Tax=unclassified Microcoleus TaxID=2642155 RepID=UPI002FD5AD69
MSIDREEINLDNWPLESGVELAHSLKIRGSGVLVGVLDTGIDADHQEFRDRTVNYCYVPLNSGQPRNVRGFDTGGHGTHVCGIIAGKNIGVAPEAKLYVASVIESETIDRSLLRIISGLDWLLDKFNESENSEPPAVLNMSLGFPSTSTQSSANRQKLEILQNRLIKCVEKLNVLPIVAIGNDGQGTYHYPGAFKECFSVGAVDFQGNIANFSGSGISEGRVKPDLVGYGVAVYSSLERKCDGQLIYKKLSGTSMATPYVTGIAALYLCEQPQLKAKELKVKLIETAFPLPNQPPERVGGGLARFVPQLTDRVNSLSE